MRSSDASYEENTLDSARETDIANSVFSRRTWLVTIGQAAVAAGFSTTLEGGTTVGPELPAGVYLPSISGLGHALMSAGRFPEISPGCPTDYIRPQTQPFTPQFFSRPEFSVICRITQLMLAEGSSGEDRQETPVTKEVAEWIGLSVASAASVRESALQLDPLHRALTVAYSGAAQVNQLETENPEKICREGFEWLAATVSSRDPDHFLSLGEEDQVAILTSISDDRPDKHSENSGTRWFAFLKREVIRGFYTSQAGLRELDFKGNAFYARSPGCDSKRT